MTSAHSFDMDRDFYDWVALADAMQRPETPKPVRIVHGARNFRNFTLPASAKPRCRSGALFRSDAMGALTVEDRKVLEVLGVRTIIDFRKPDEIRPNDAPHIPTVRNRFNLPIGPAYREREEAREGNYDDSESVTERLRVLVEAGSDEEAAAFAQRHVWEIFSFYCQWYGEFVTECAPIFAKFLEIILSPDNHPVIFHCRGGKDRTGFAAAIVLLLLGYSREEVMHDYLATNRFQYEDSLALLSRVTKVHPVLRPFVGAHPRWMTSAFDAIDEHYGSFDAYRTKALGVSDDDVTRLRSALCVTS